MRIFVTGSTGFVGSAVVGELLSRGHTVLGLVRSDAGAAALTARGAEAWRGDLGDLPRLRDGAARADAVIHTAFDHDFTKYAESCAHDARVIAALADAFVGTTRPLVVTSAMGAAGFRPTAAAPLATEDVEVHVGPGSHPRVQSEEAVTAAVARGVHASLVRLPPSVHGEGDPHFVATLVAVARRTRTSAYVGEGTHRWSAVHRLDAARLFRLVAEAGLVDGRFHAVAEEGIALRELALRIGTLLEVPVVSLSPDEASRHFGGFTRFASLDAPASSAVTRARLAWEPRERDLLADLAAGAYGSR